MNRRRFLGAAAAVTALPAAASSTADATTRDGDTRDSAPTDGGEAGVDDVEHEHRTEEVAGLSGFGTVEVDDVDATVRATLDRDWDGREWFHVLGLEIQSHHMQIGVTLDVDEAERVADQLHRLVDQAREDGAK